jgi:hypothetical protein
MIKLLQGRGVVRIRMDVPSAPLSIVRRRPKRSVMRTPGAPAGIFGLSVVIVSVLLTLKNPAVHGT